VATNADRRRPSSELREMVNLSAADVPARGFTPAALFP
jgi:hypothetical protein